MLISEPVMYVEILFWIVDAASETVVNFVSDSDSGVACVGVSSSPLTPSILAGPSVLLVSRSGSGSGWLTSGTSLLLFKFPINSNSTPSYSPLIVVFPVLASVTIFIDEIIPLAFNSFNLSSSALNPSSNSTFNKSSKLNVELLCWLLSVVREVWDELFVAILGWNTSNDVAFIFTPYFDCCN